MEEETVRMLFSKDIIVGDVCQFQGGQEYDIPLSLKQKYQVRGAIVVGLKPQVEEQIDPSINEEEDVLDGNDEAPKKGGHKKAKKHVAHKR